MIVRPARPQPRRVSTSQLALRNQYTNWIISRTSGAFTIGERIPPLRQQWSVSQGSLMGRNGESGAFGLAAARGGVASAGAVGARFARFGTGIGSGAGTSNVASLPLRDRGGQ